MLSKTIIKFFLVLAGLFSANFAYASVVINEIAWMGTESSVNDEWLELYNPGQSSVILDAWVLRAADGSPEITLTGILLGQSFFLLERTDDTTVPGISADQIYTGALKNSGENLQLYDSQGNLIDSVNCSSGWFAGDNASKQTMERKSAEGSGNNESNWGTSQNPHGTPKAKNTVTLTSPSPPEEQPSQPPAELESIIQATTTGPNNTINPETKPALNQQEKEPPAPPAPAPLPIAYASGIVISEILPSPEGPDKTEEWIELKNLNQKEIDLSQWKIQDTTGSLTTYTVPEGTKIGPDGFLVLSRPVTKITLNNSGDGLLLLQPNGNILDKVIYDKAGLGQSYNRLVQDWQWSNVLTPGRDNVLPLSINSKEVSPKEASAKNGTSTMLQDLENPSELAAIGQQLPKNSKFFFTLLIAFGSAIFSGGTILILKKTLKTNLNKCG